MMLWSWRPFVPDLSAASIAEQFSAVHWIPLRAMAQRVDLFSVADIVTQFLLYLPLGALLAVWPLKRNGPFRGILPAFYLAIILELGKIVVAERFFDVTHILIQVAGAAVGWIVVRRSGFAPYGELGLPTLSRQASRNRRASRSKYP
jgi:glycopeptide antibiotics resistance protein